MTAEIEEASEELPEDVTQHQSALRRKHLAPTPANVARNNGTAVSMQGHSDLRRDLRERGDILVGDFELVAPDPTSESDNMGLRLLQREIAIRTRECRIHRRCRCRSRQGLALVWFRHAPRQCPASRSKRVGKTRHTLGLYRTLHSQRVGEYLAAICSFLSWIRR